VKLAADHRTDTRDGWAQIVVPMADLNPRGKPFDRVEFRTFRPVDDWTLLDRIALTKPAAVAASASPLAAADAGALGKLVNTRVACDGSATRISPYIYGIALTEGEWGALGATVRRWGGNQSSRYNWQNDFMNHGQDWYFENFKGPSYSDFLNNSSARGALAALTVPTLGWVAKDATSYSFPVSVFGAQKQTDPYRPDEGNGTKPSGVDLVPGPPTRTSVAAPPAWVEQWVKAIVDGDTKAGQKTIYEYILDNEPMIWSHTHRDVRPDPLGYDELLQRTIDYASAVRRADPGAIIAGPAEWGWSNYTLSGKDLASPLGVHVDRIAHGNVPLDAWYLQKLRDYEQKTGVRLLDVFDLHYYPQEANVYGGGTGGVDRATQLLRLRSTRSLWDDTYVDESWIHDTVRLLPRMKELVEKNYPGRGISIGEWNFGGEMDITGALATAEALGRFAQFGVTSAFYWLRPPQGSPSFFGFRAYRNFDDRGGRFLDWYVPTTPVQGASFFASRDVDGKHLVIVAINFSPDTVLTAAVDVSSCGAVESAQAYTYGSGSRTFAATSAAAEKGPTAVTLALPSWSIAVVDLHLRGAKP
jgi:hypothetical protein